MRKPPSSIPSVVGRSLSKRFGDTRVLDAVDLDLTGGMCLCVLGRNGAGKSTLIHLLADLIAPDAGHVHVDDMTYADQSVAIKSRLGVFPEQNPAIPELTGTEYLEFIGRLHGLPFLPWPSLELLKLLLPLLERVLLLQFVRLQQTPPAPLPTFFLPPPVLL